MKKHFILTIIFIFLVNISFGQTKKRVKTKQRGHSSLDGDFYIDGFKYYSKLSKSDSIKILKDVASKLNGKWTTKENNYVDEFKLNDTTFEGHWYNLDVILATPYVRLEFINGQVKFITTKTICEAYIDYDTLNIWVTDDELNINGLIHQRQKNK